MVTITDNLAYDLAQPRLSVLIPFLRDDPTELIQQLDTEAEALRGRAEIILMDDGTQDDVLTARLTKAVLAACLPIRLISLSQNEGRSVGRNRLAENARGQSLLFLDSDMKPDIEDFLRQWTEVAEKGDTPVAFGGFSLLQAPMDARFSVHRAMAGRSDCLTAAQRRLHPEKYVFTSNLLIQKNVFETEAFDPGFSGWGWEDVEWAMRVSRRYRVQHLDIPATHMGLDTVQTLIGKYEQSAPNFARVLAQHPDFVTAYPSYRVARLIRKLPARGLLRSLLKTASSNDIIPVKLRALSLRLYRAALYSEVV